MDTRTALRRLAAVLVLALGLLVASASTALAQAGDASPDAPASATLTLNNLAVQLLLGAVLPLAIGLVQRPENPGWVKSIVAVVLAFVATGISEAVQADGSAILSVGFLVDGIIVAATAIVSYLGLWSHVPTSGGGGVNTLGVSLVPPIDVSSRRRT